MTLKKHSVEDLMSALLKKGVLLSGGLILIGWVQSILETSQGSLVHQQVWEALLSGQSHLSFSPESMKSDILHGQFVLASSVWITLGLLVLLFVPVLRVMLAAWVFYREKDYLFVLFSCVVLTVLLGSLFLGHGGG